jgi:hypothetical protein
MDRKGKSLERLVASIEKAIAHEKNVQVQSPMRLIDRTTGKLREHDVVLTLKEGHHIITIAIECRDRSRPITVNQVEGFWAKCQDTGVDQGIIVSSMGFYNTARKKAKHRGMRCLGIEEVESFDWLLAPGLQSITTKLIRNDWTFFPEEDGIVEKGNMEIIDKEGNRINQAILTSNAQQQLNKLLPKIPDPIESGELNVRFEGGGLHLRNSDTGETTPVKFAIAKLQYSVSVDTIPFKLVHYRDKDSDENITDAAVAQFQFGENTGKVMIVYKEGEGGRVVYVPEKNKNT